MQIPETTTTATEPLFPENEAAALINVKTPTLRTWRCNKRHPLPYVKIGRMIRYRKSDIDRFIAQHVQKGN